VLLALLATLALQGSGVASARPPFAGSAGAGSAVARSAGAGSAVVPSAMARPAIPVSGAVSAGVGAAVAPASAGSFAQVAQAGADSAGTGAAPLAAPGALGVRAVGVPGTDTVVADPGPGAVAPPKIGGVAAILADERTGQVLFERNSNQQRAMASTTKVMTALLSLERLNQNRTVVIGTEPTTVGEESLGLRAGERLTVHQLLLGLLVKSANDAAVALADAVDGNAAAFVRRMNARAAQLHLDETHYVTPFGLDRPGHYTSARDLARLWEVAMRRPDFRALVATRSAQIPGPPGLRKFTSTDTLLGSYQWVEGGKTGFTNDAGRCLVASASRGGRRLVAVVLGSQDAFPDVRALFEYGFTAFDWVRVASRGQEVTIAPSGGQPTEYQVTADANALVRRDLVGQLGVAPPAELVPAPGVTTGTPAPVASTAPPAGGASTTGPRAGGTQGPNGTATVWIQAGGQRLVPMRLGPAGSVSGGGDAPPTMSSVAAGLVPAGSPSPVINAFLRQAPP
jgi:serine-type D-Ala-D-Ala carboxypeptidase (penicillin-binding protein 5/6)